MLLCCRLMLKIFATAAMRQGVCVFVLGKIERGVCVPGERKTTLGISGAQLLFLSVPSLLPSSRGTGLPFSMSRVLGTNAVALADLGIISSCALILYIAHAY